MLRNILIYILVSLFSLNGFAADKWPDGSAMSIGTSYKKISDIKKEKIDRVLNNIDTLLRKHLSGNLADTLNNFHLAWENYADIACSVARETFEGASTWKSARSAKCRRNLFDQRLFKLVNSYKCMQRHIKNNRKYEMPQCFYQTLSVKL
jgi:hypothetical protein